MSAGAAPFYIDGEVFCARCSGHKAMQCAGCGVSFVDIGVGGCPFCSYRLIREL